MKWIVNGAWIGGLCLILGAGCAEETNQTTTDLDRDDPATVETRREVLPDDADTDADTDTNIQLDTDSDNVPATPPPSDTNINVDTDTEDGAATQLNPAPQDTQQPGGNQPPTAEESPEVEPVE